MCISCHAAAEQKEVHSQNTESKYYRRSIHWNSFPDQKKQVVGQHWVHITLLLNTLLFTWTDPYSLHVWSHGLYFASPHLTVQMHWSCTH
jgi:hypothetical protein